MSTIGGFMTGVIVTGGNAPAFSCISEILEKADFIIAADSGLNTLLLYGYDPDLIIGDMDSVSDRSILGKFPPEIILEYPEDKDFTDSELALNYLLDKGYTENILIGGGGGRLDHSIALYSLFSRENSPFLWVTDKEKIFLVKDRFSIKLKKNSLVSLFPVGVVSCIMESEGLKWSLNGLKWIAGDSGISNIALDETIIINMKSGKLIMITPLENK